MWLWFPICKAILQYIVIQCVSVPIYSHCKICRMSSKDWSSKKSESVKCVNENHKDVFFVSCNVSLMYHCIHCGFHCTFCVFLCIHIVFQSEFQWEFQWEFQSEPSALKMWEKHNFECPCQVTSGHQDISGTGGIQEDQGRSGKIRKQRSLGYCTDTT